jgi:uncharacterized delta-60 repeat protein
VGRRRVRTGIVLGCALLLCLAPLSAHAGASDGTVDPSFNIGAGFDNEVGAIALQSDGKILVGGSFHSSNATPINALVRLNTDGSLDSTFNMGGSGFDSSAVVDSLAVQPDGEILVGGEFSVYNGDSHVRLMRLNPDGSADPGFDVGGGFNFPVQTLALQPDGKIVAGGSFTMFNGNPQNRMTRLNSDGSLDASFNIGSGASNAVFSVVLQPDGKVLVGGGFQTFNGATLHRLVRLNPDGSIDPSLNVGSGFNALVASIALLPDGRFLAGGAFSTYQGGSAPHLAQLNPDGSVDPTFNIGSGFDNIVQSVVLQPDGKILAGGYFISFQGTTEGHMARLLSDGSADPTGFNANMDPGFNGAVVLAIALQPDAKILVGGDFTELQGQVENRLVRLNNSFAPMISGTAPLAVCQQPFTFALDVTGPPAPTVSLTGGSLPTGLELSSSGVISGTPVQEGTFAFEVTADNGTPPAAVLDTSITVSTCPRPPLPPTGVSDTGLAAGLLAGLFVIGGAVLTAARRRVHLPRG